MKNFLLSIFILASFSIQAAQSLLNKRPQRAKQQHAICEAQIIARLIDERHDITDLERTDPQLSTFKANDVADQLLQMPQHEESEYSAFTDHQDPQSREPQKTIKRYQLLLRHGKAVESVEVCASYEPCQCGGTFLKSKEYSLKIKNNQPLDSAKKVREEFLRLLVLPKSSRDLQRLQIYRVALIA